MFTSNSRRVRLPVSRQVREGEGPESPLGPRHRGDHQGAAATAEGEGEGQLCAATTKDA